jgi:hypothetical protein
MPDRRASRRFDPLESTSPQCRLIFHVARIAFVRANVSTTPRVWENHMSICSHKLRSSCQLNTL